MNYQKLPAYGKLIYVTVVVYLFTQLWKILTVLFCWSGNDWAHWLALPANLNDFALRPWTLLTYMFCHANLSQQPFHILFNMLCLYTFGALFMRNHRGRQLVSFYLVSGVMSGLFFLVCYNVFPFFRLDRFLARVVGASGAIYALIIAVAMRQPEELVGLNLFVRVVPVRLKWLAAGVVVLSFFCFSAGNVGFGVGNYGGVACHVGGILFGLLYGWADRRGTDLTRWPLSLYDAVTGWLRSLRQPRMTAMRGGRRESIPADRKRDMDYNVNKRTHEEQINAILDKISRSGYDGLTAEEKQMLFDASRRGQKR